MRGRMAATVALAVSAALVAGALPALTDAVERSVRPSAMDLMPDIAEGDLSPVRDRRTSASVLVRPEALVLPPRSAAMPVGFLAAGAKPQGPLVAAYTKAVGGAPQSCRLRVSVLAAIGQVESGSLGGRTVGPDHRAAPPVLGPVLDGGKFAAIRDSDAGRFDGDRVWDRAVGPMQFIPSTWAWAGRDGDGDRVKDPQNVYDAALAAAGYLCRGGRDLTRTEDLRAAIWSYNHSTEYVSTVLHWIAYFDKEGLGGLGRVAVSVPSGGRASQIAPGSLRSGSSTRPRRTDTTLAAGPATASRPPSTTPTSVRPSPSPTSTTATPTPVTTTPSTTTTTTATPVTTTATSTTTTATSATTTAPSPTTTTPSSTTTTTPSSTTTTTPSPTSTTCEPEPTSTESPTPTPVSTTPTSEPSTTPTSEPSCTPPTTESDEATPTPSTSSATAAEHSLSQGS